MAHIFRPITVKPIPPHAQKCVQGRKPAARWKNRQGEWTIAQLTKDGTKCRVPSPYYYVEWTDAGGLRQREKVSKRIAAAQKRLAAIVEDLERERDGLAPLSSIVTVGTLHSLAEEYRDFLRGHGRSEQHYTDTFRQITAVAKWCGWIRVQDVTLAAWSRWVNKQTEGDDAIAAETVNHYLRSLRGFFRWLVRGRRLGSDPLVGAKLLNAAADRKVMRRTLEPAELVHFVAAVRRSKKIWVGLDGPARAALYLTAARTGLRSGTLAKLRPEDLRLDDSIPHIATEAGQQKNKRSHSVPLSPDLVDELRSWLAVREPSPLLWPGKWHSQHRGSTIIRRDLAIAGIPFKTLFGVYDFHALRGQCGTDLALAGVPLVVTQKFLGHSTPALTARYYVRVGLADLADAANSVGRSLGWNSPKDPESLGSRAGQTKTGKSRKKKGKASKR